MTDTTDLDELMSRDPLELTNDDIEALITQQRKYRASREAGIKPTRKPTASAPPIDLKKLGLVKEAEPVKRRF